MGSRETLSRMPVDDEWAKQLAEDWKAFGRAKGKGAKEPFLKKIGLGKNTASRLTSGGHAGVDWDSIERLRAGLEAEGFTSLPPVVEAMRSTAHHRWTLAGRDTDAELAEWAEIGRRLQAVGKLAKATKIVREMVDLGDPLERSSEEIPLSLRGSGSLRTDSISDDDQGSDLPGKTRHGSQEVGSIARGKRPGGVGGTRRTSSSR